MTRVCYLLYLDHWEDPDDLFGVFTSKQAVRRALDEIERINGPQRSIRIRPFVLNQLVPHQDRYSWEPYDWFNWSDWDRWYRETLPGILAPPPEEL